MVDLFEEVEGNLRAEKLKDTGQRFLPWILGGIFGVLVIGGGYVGWDYWQTVRTQKASEAYQAILTGQMNDPEEGFKAFGDIAAKAPAGYKTLALMNQAAIRLEQGKDKEAVELFDKAAKSAPMRNEGKVLADLASLKSALALMDSAPYADIEARLKPLTEDGRPYRAMAIETLALAKLANGKTADARLDFLKLSADVSAPETVAARAKQAVDFIDNGSAASVTAAMKAAKEMPAANPMGNLGIPPEILEQLQAQGLKVQGAPAK